MVLPEGWILGIKTVCYLHDASAKQDYMTFKVSNHVSVP